MTRRLNYIDLIRAYSIFLVTGYHLWRFFGKPSYDILVYDAFSIFQKGWAGVELFFFISGYTMALITYEKFLSEGNNFDWKSYFLKRLYRIVPSYYVAILIWSVLVFNGVAPKPIGLMDQLSHLLFINTFNVTTYYSISGVFWSLAIEMQFYFILPIVLIYIIKYPIISLLVSFIPISYNLYFKKVFLIDMTFIGFIIYFILGYIVYIYKDNLYEYLFKNKYSKYVLVFFIIAFLNVTFLKEYMLNNKIHVLIWLICFIPLFVYIYRLEQLQITKSKILNLFIFTGTASYSIYLYNYIFYINPLPYRYTLDAVIFYFLLIYLTGIAMYFLIERNFQKMKKIILRRFKSEDK